jgi:FAD/FMN-containing dehydrogenase
MISQTDGHADKKNTCFAWYGNALAASMAWPVIRVKTLMNEDIIEKLRTIVGDSNVLTGDQKVDRSAIWRTNQPCIAKAIVRPSCTAEVSAVMKACHEQQQTVVPYGGMTNLVLGAVTTPDDIALSFERMNEIENIDRTSQTMTVQSGVTMQDAQERAEAEGLYFPVDIGARANCMLGGNVSTNAGGTRVIRYGMIRESVLGIEAVLADGTVISSMNRFLKNNSGFDLKHLFIGSEGVLGLITRLVFRLRIKPQSHNVALVACDDYDQVIGLLNKARASLGNSLSGFEVMWDNFFHVVVQPNGRLPSPIDTAYKYYIIMEATGVDAATDDEIFESTLTQMFESELVADGVIAKSDAEREAIWAIRHDVDWIVGDAFDFDISLPVADISEYTEAINVALKKDIEGVEVVTFGHLGDNNLHISVQCDGAKTTHAHTIERHIYETLKPYGGAISAEHGIGLEKKEWLPISRSEAEIELMRTLKRSMDPRNILNPGKVISMD